MRHSASHQPGITTLSNDGDSSVSAGRNNERDVAGIGRPNDGERVAVKEAAPFPEMGCNLCGGLEDVLLPQALSETEEKIGGSSHGQLWAGDRGVTRSGEAGPSRWRLRTHLL